MLLSAVLVPLILLAMVLAPSWYGKWKTYCEQTGLPLPAPERPIRTRLARAVGRTLRVRADSPYRWIRMVRQAWDGTRARFRRR